MLLQRPKHAVKNIFCGSTDLMPLKDCYYDGLGPSGQWRSARTLRLRCPTLTERADVHVKRKLGSATTYFVPNIGSQFNSEQKDLFHLKRVSILDNHSNHSPFPEIGTRHPFKMLNPSDWEAWNVSVVDFTSYNKEAPLKEILTRSPGTKTLMS